ncbi:MAG: hypothetical protein VXX85_02895 [Candidatus Margulisiibacteriota bacterium]|nr:hypothetical protein [Candidatus Margulisiibacteriota bacterium]
MRKILLSIICLLALNTISFASPQFGLMAEQNAGLGPMISLEKINAHLLLTSTSNDSSSETNTTKISIGVEYKVPVANKITGLLGLHYGTTSGELDGSDIDTLTTVGLSIGIAHAITDKLMAHTKMSVVEFSDYGDDNADFQTTSIFTNVRVGICHLF